MPSRDVDAPFNFVADAFYRKYEETISRVGSLRV